MSLAGLEFGTSSYIGIVAGGLSYFALGALWYTALFRDRWMAATGRTRDEFTSSAQDSSPAWMGLTLLGAIVSTAVVAVAYQWGGGEGVLDGLVVGAIVGVGVAAMEGLKNAVYNFDERVRPWELYAINAAYAIAGLLLAGTVYGLIE